jgi:hypothetical protein
MKARHHFALLAVASLAALTACGSSTSTSGRATTSSSQLPGEQAGQSATLDESARATTSSSNPKAPAIKPASRPKASSPDPISAHNHTVKARHRAKNEQRGTGIAPLNPCTLVTRSEARTILHRPIVGVTQAPQGPTCIYKARQAKSVVTMAIQVAPFDPKKHPARNVTRATLRGHKAYCVKDHGLAMMVPLAAGRLLRVSAPCPIASGFASKALAKLYP